MGLFGTSLQQHGQSESEVVWDTSPHIFSLIYVFKFAFGGQLAPTPEDIPEPSHDRVLRKKFCSVHVVKGL